MTCATLTIRDLETNATRVEGFESLDQAAAWMKVDGGNPALPDLVGVIPSMHDDHREVMMEMETPDALARFLTRLEYPHADVRAAVREQFPTADLDAVMTDAAADKQAVDAETTRALDDEAVSSEFDLGAKS